MKRLAVLLLPLLAVTACSSLDEDKALDEQLDTDDRDEFVEGIVIGARGMIVRSEAECWSDAVLATGATPADLDRFAADPFGPGAAEYTRLLADCVDPSIEADAPIDGEVRTAFTEGLESNGLTTSQAECMLDGLDAAGFDGRDMFLAGVLPAAETDLSVGLDAVAADCL